MSILIKIANKAELKPGEIKICDVDGIPIALYNVDGKFYATDDICTHDGGTLADGELAGHEIICPRHGARFDIRTGKALCMPAFTSIRTYPVKIDNNEIYIELD